MPQHDVGTDVVDPTAIRFSVPLSRSIDLPVNEGEHPQLHGTNKKGEVVAITTHL